jgi:hypothetical protein
MSQINPPQILVKTWLYLLTAGEEESILHAKRMLVGAFGSVELAIIYMEQEKESLKLRA